MADKPKLLETALARFKVSAEAESGMRKLSLDDLKFSVGEQWPETYKANRTLKGKPCLTMNRLPQFIRQVTNEQRQQRPAIQINPSGDGADVETAQIFQGMVRHIEVNSDAEVAYDVAFEDMVRIGFGWLQILTEQVDEESKRQEILIKPIRNAFTVYDDPAATEIDRSDARFRFVVSDMPWDEYKQEHGNSAMGKMDSSSLNELVSTGDNPPQWVTKDEEGSYTVRVANYYYRENGKVECAKINAIEVLEEKHWAGKWIPVIPVLGDDLMVDGKRYVAGLVRNAKDPQREYNYWHSAATEKIALDPKAPFIATPKQIEGLEKYWETANTENWSTLLYNPHIVGTVLMPPPQRQVIQGQIDAYVKLIQLADNDLKASTGIYDASLGERGPEQSGRAINQRKQQGDIATLNFSDNLARSIRHVGRQLVDLIPHIYDVPAIQRIIKPDQSIQHVGIFNSHNASQEEASQTLQGADNSGAITKVYDIGVGSYDVSISVGQLQTKREQTASALIDLAKVYPPIMQLAGDVVVGNMDFQNADVVAKRLKKSIPPQFLDDSEDDSPENKLTKLQAQMSTLAQQHEQLTQALSHANEIIQTKQTEQDGKLAIEKLHSETQIAVAEITTKSQEVIQRFKFENDLAKQFHISAHDAATQAGQQGHEMATQASDQAHAADTQAIDHSHEQDVLDQQGAQQSQLQAEAAAQQPVNGKAQA